MNTRRTIRVPIMASVAGIVVLGIALGFWHKDFGAHISIMQTAKAGEPFYTCPMHPNIVKTEPGTCPICGMQLVRKQTPDLPDSKKTAERPAAKKKGERKIKYWVAPMDSTYIRDKPGKSPMGMDLVPVYEDEGGSSPGTVSVDPVMVQNMGVRVARVARSSLSRRVRAIGEIDVAENRVSVVNLRFSGWIEKIYADQTGQAVRKGQALFSIYSPELVSAQKEYLIAYNTSGKDSDLTRSAAERVRLWDIPQSVLDRVAEKQNVDRTIIIRAPRNGYILHKNVVEGARIVAGTDLYRIGNLKTIWVNTEVYEFDAPWIRVGQEASMELSYEKGRRFTGKVNYIYPTLNKKSRTLTVRLEFDNPGIELKPGMFATVWIETQHKDGVLVIPTESIIHSGERQIVFVTKELGKYESREVVTGLVGDGHRTQVLSGLSEGENVVTSGQFLLDSESQLQEAVQKLLEARLQAKEKQTTAGVSSSAPGASHEQQKKAETYWTCGMHPQVVQDHPGTCPICGMDLIEKRK